MPGRTEATTAREIEDSAWQIMFELDEVRKWLLTLSNRARRNAERSHENMYVAADQAATMEGVAVAATQAAYDLEGVTEWIKNKL